MPFFFVVFRWWWGEEGVGRDARLLLSRLARRLQHLGPGLRQQARPSLAPSTPGRSNNSDVHGANALPGHVPVKGTRIPVEPRTLKSARWQSTF